MEKSMNSMTLMAEVFTNPELRSTPDNQIPVASFLVQFPGTKPEEAPYRLKVIGWNNLATEIQEKYQKGDQVMIEGRLNINTIDRGSFKEKRVELTASRIYPVGAVTNSAGTVPQRPPATDPMPAPPLMGDVSIDELPF